MSCSLLFSIVFKEIEVHQLVASDHLDRLSTIADHSYLVVEGDHADLALVGALSHIFDLGVNRSLKALNPGNIGLVLIGGIEELVRAVTERHQALHLLTPIAFNVVLALNGLRDAH